MESLGIMKRLRTIGRVGIKTSLSAKRVAKAILFLFDFWVLK